MRDIRTLGAVGVIELHDAVDVTAVTAAAIRHGVWVRPFRNLVYTMPPYISTRADIAQVTAGMVAAVAEVHEARVLKMRVHETQVHERVPARSGSSS